MIRRKDIKILIELRTVYCTHRRRYYEMWCVQLERVKRRKKDGRKMERKKLLKIESRVIGEECEKINRRNRKMRKEK
jgi:hypothetical protein